MGRGMEDVLSAAFYKNVTTQGAFSANNHIGESALNIDTQFSLLYLFAATEIMSLVAVKLIFQWQ